MTLWMQDRLRFVRTRQGGESEAVDNAKAALCEDIQTRNAERNQLTTEGVGDQYLFTAGALLEVIGQDGGAEGLAAPAEGRVWLSVTYSSKERALRDHVGAPIHDLAVGLNFDEHGRVLKAGVRSVAEIDWNSISTEWPEKEAN